MLLKLGSGTGIAYPPFFFGPSRKAHLTISSKSVFHPDHVTSRLSLQFLDEALRSGSCRSLLDVGCGSGVLALLAAHKGVELVAGLDIDGRAIAMARENAERNHLAERTHWLVGTIAAIRRSFECVVANLPYVVIDGILDDLEGVVEPNGTLILSGFHDIQWHELVGKLAQRGFSMEKTASGDQSFYGPPPSGSFTWMAIRMRKYPEK